MTLSESLAAAKAERSPPCVEIEYRSVSAVTFCPWQAPEWTLPWSRLEALRFSIQEESEKLVLFFPNHHVIAVGDGFRRVIAELREFKVSFLRSLPAVHRAALGPRSPFIATLEVQLVTEGPKPAPAGVLF